MESPSQMHFMQLPECVFEEILAYLSYDEISKYRLVSRAWNNKCKQVLTRGFYAVEKFHARSFKNVKSLLPRRESERRNHTMARHCDILTAIETRLSMLSMTFSKYIDVGMCCFIPGKVIDEIFRVLRFIKEMRNPPRAHEILQELRDISSMAMEHFDEKIVPQLKETLAFNTTYSITGGPRVGGTRASPSAALMSASRQGAHSLTRAGFQVAVQKLRLEFIRHAAGTRRNKIATNAMKKRVDKLAMRVKKQNVGLRQKVAQQDAKLAEMKCQLEECNQKITDLKAKMSKVAPDISDVVVALPATRSGKRGREVNAGGEAERDQGKSAKKKHCGK